MEKSKSLHALLFFVILYILKIGQAIFLPFAIALFFWGLIYILSTNYSKILIDKFKLPNWTKIVSKTLAVATIAGVVYFIVMVIKDNIDAVSSTFDNYKHNINEMLLKVQDYFGVKNKLTVSQIIKDIDINSLLNTAIFGVANFLKTTLMVLIYLLFIMLEEKSFYKKFPLLFKDKKEHEAAVATLKKIYSKIQTYLSVKFFLSALTALFSYIVMQSINLDFAMFWAIIIFILNFIPNVGAIVASALPILLSLLQFNGELFPFAVVAIGITAIQVVIGNIIDPKITGKKLNLSPLVLILSLVIWGYIWGIAGMFLCVPIMIIVTIILSQIKSTKKFAVLLTGDGEGL